MSENQNFNDFFPEDSTSNTTAPKLLCEKVKSDHEEWYMLRLTPENDDYNMGDIIESLLKPLSEGSWFIAEESTKKGIKHYHSVFLSYKDPREDIKQWLVSIYPNKWKKQDGNKRYNLQQVEQLEKAFTYTSKDGDYMNGPNINPEYIKYVNSKSFQKKDARINQLSVIRQQFIKGDITDRQLFSKVCSILVATSTTGSLNPQLARNFVIGAKYSKDPESYSDQLFDSLKI